MDQVRCGDDITSHSYILSSSSIASRPHPQQQLLLATIRIQHTPPILIPIANRPERVPVLPQLPLHQRIPFPVLPIQQQPPAGVVIADPAALRVDLFLELLDLLNAGDGFGDGVLEFLLELLVVKRKELQ